MTLLESVAAGAALGITAAIAMDMYDEVRTKDPIKRAKKHQKNKRVADNLDDYTRKLIWG
ncbi:MAG: hypothetical protein M0R51_12000 [Clostridia bacterium]|jgi:hypothetical protein|nr:hypothetical protein [Clostridia bacterium]